MGILKTLLTGGSILGRICQTISESVSNEVLGENGKVCMVRASQSEVNGVRFTQVVEDGKTKLCAFNTDVDMYACVTYPNGYEKTKGAQIFIPPLETMELPIGDYDSASPELPFHVQKIDLSKGAAMDNNRAILSFNELALNGAAVEIYTSKLTATLYQLEVYFPTAGLGDLAAAEFQSENGVRAILREPVAHIEKSLGTTCYSIPFGVFGFTEKDLLSGIMQFKISDQNAARLKEAADQAAEESGLHRVSEHMCKLCGIEKK